jgi:hypothetical protein
MFFFTRFRLINLKVLLNKMINYYLFIFYFGGVFFFMYAFNPNYAIKLIKIVMNEEN